MTTRAQGNEGLTVQNISMYSLMKLLVDLRDLRG